MNVLQFPIDALDLILIYSRHPCPFIEGLLGAQAFVQLHVVHVLVDPGKALHHLPSILGTRRTQSLKARAFLWASTVPFPHPSST